MSTGLPPIDPAFEPASVRSGSPATQKAYASALNFESMLVQQLSQSLTESSEGESEGSSGDPVSTQLSSLLPQTLTNSVMSHGGLGMAQQLMGSLLPETSSKVSSTGGVKA
jgi:Rod binding domain-containing protein